MYRDSIAWQAGGGLGVLATCVCARVCACIMHVCVCMYVCVLRHGTLSMIYLEYREAGGPRASHSCTVAQLHSRTDLSWVGLPLDSG